MKKGVKKYKNLIIMFGFALALLIINVIFIFMIKDDITKEVRVTNHETEAYTINYDGYSFELSNEVDHEYYVNELILTYTSSNIVTKIMNVDYQKIVNSSENIKTKLQENSILIEKSYERKYNGTTYYVFEITKDNQKALLAFSNLAGGNSIMLLIINENNEYHYKPLEVLSKTIKDSSYYGDRIVKEIDSFNIEDIINSITE